MEQIVLQNVNSWFGMSKKYVAPQLSQIKIVLFWQIQKTLYINTVYSSHLQLPSTCGDYHLACTT
jgi:hypothetical protein